MDSGNIQVVVSITYNIAYVGEDRIATNLHHCIWNRFKIYFSFWFISKFIYFLYLIITYFFLFYNLSLIPVYYIFESFLQINLNILLLFSIKQILDVIKLSISIKSVMKLKKKCLCQFITNLKKFLEMMLKEISINVQNAETWEYFKESNFALRNTSFISLKDYLYFSIELH